MALASELMGMKFNHAPKVSGKIRPGIMVLTKKSSENSEAVTIYNDGVKKGMSFEQIGDALQKKFGQNGMLRPINVPYFSVRAQDFAMPEIAKLILDKFGEDRGEGKRLYRFPIVFGYDELTKILDFRFQMYTASGLKFWSDESKSGNERVCRTFAPIEMRNNKAIRNPGGREVINRADNSGVCNPSKCNEFQTNQCKMRGRLLFYIPGIPGAGMFEIPTGSKNFGFESEKTLTDVLAATGGTLRGLSTDRPVFWLTKKFKKDMPMIDWEKGTTTRTDQWVIEIEADLDMGRIIDNPASLQIAANKSANILLGNTTGQTENPTDVKLLADAKVENEATHSWTVQTLRPELADKLSMLDIMPEEFGVYAAGIWGATWSKDLEKLQKAYAEILEGLEHPQEYREVVLNAQSGG